jgi:hypothetical protein
MRGRGASATIGSGIVLGLAGLVRPMACFAAGGVMIALLVRRRFNAALTIGVVAANVFLAGVVALHAWTGDALFGARVYASNPGAYGGEMFAWPFKSLIETPARGGASIGRVVYIYAHVLLTLVAGSALAARWVRFSVARPESRSLDPRDAVALPWLAGNTVFVLCVGSHWGFDHFPRFGIPAMPALFWAVRRFLPDRWYLWAALLAAVFVFAVIGVRESP